MIINISKLRRNTSFGLLCIYCFVISFGNAFRGTEEASSGLPTYIIGMFLLLNFFTAISLIVRTQYFILLSILFVLLFLSGFMNPFDIIESIKSSFLLLSYIIMTVSVYSLRLNNESIYILYLFIALGIFFSCFITIIDYFNIYDFIGVNDLSYVSSLDGLKVVQASGFFPRRSAMAAYFSLLLPVCFVIAFSNYSFKYKLFFLFSGLLGCISLLLTHNRSGLIAVGFSIIMYFIFIDKRISIKSLIAKLPVLVVIALGIWLFGESYLQEHVDIFLVKILQAPTDDSDYIRVAYFLGAFENMLNHPVGQGFGMVYLDGYGINNTHNIFSSILWATGLPGLIWLFIFSFISIKMFSYPSKFLFGETKTLFYSSSFGLFAWLINSLAHDDIGTGMAWILFGVVLSLLEPRVVKVLFKL